MQKKFIVNYVKTLSKNDIENFAIKNNISYSKKDVEIVYEFIQKYHNSFFDNPLYHIKLLDGKVSKNIYDIIVNFYHEYENYLNN